MVVSVDILDTWNANKTAEGTESILNVLFLKQKKENK